MKKQLFMFSFLLSLVIFLSACSLIYGEKIYEEEKAYDRETTFRFNLTEDSLHSINLRTSYKSSIQRVQGEFMIELIDPTGEKQTKPYSIRNSDRKSSASPIGHTSNIFQVTPTQGTYTLNVIENPDSDIRGESLTVKIYKK